MISIAIIASIGEKSTGPVLNFINNLRNGATTGSVILARNWYILPDDEYGLYATKKLITHMAIRAKEINCANKLIARIKTYITCQLPPRTFFIG